MKTAVDDIKERIKQTPISSIIGNYIAINKRGANFECICPFHSDTKPSLKINDNKGIYKCFACGASGDAIKFVQEFKDLEFIDALKDIGSHLGLAVDDLSLKKKVDPRQEYGIRVVTAANKLYRKYTDQQKPKTYTDFLKKRNLTPEIAAKFEITYVPKQNMLSDYLKTLPQDQQESAMKAGLDIGIVREGQWGNYDFFRERIMFPIWDHYGQIRGFSSRAVRDDQIPKYLNSGESFIFDKGNILFGFNFARSSIRSTKKVLVVEGHMDVISAHQAGFDFTVGCMGTALSVNNIRLLTSIAEDIYIGMDNDDAGYKAAVRINKDLLKAKVFAKYLDYSPEKDPDDFLVKFSRLELTKRMEEAPLLIDVIISRLIPKEIPPSAEQKLKILELVFDELSPIGDHLMASMKIIEASKQLGMNTTADSVTEAYKRYLTDNKSLQRDRQIVEIKRKEEEVHAKQARAERQTQKIEPILGRAEAGLVKAIVSHPELISHVTEQQVLDLVTHSKVKHFISWIFQLYFEIDETEYLSFMRTKFSKEDADPEIKDIVMSALFDFRPETLNEKVAEKMLKDITTRLTVERLKEKRKELTLNHKEAVTENESTSLLKQIGEVNKELNNLKRF